MLPEVNEQLASTQKAQKKRKASESASGEPNKNKNRKHSVKTPCKKCGALTHKTSRSRLCPYNKKYQTESDHDGKLASVNTTADVVPSATITEVASAAPSKVTHTYTRARTHTHTHTHTHTTISHTHRPKSSAASPPATLTPQQPPRPLLPSPKRQKPQKRKKSPRHLSSPCPSLPLKLVTTSMLDGSKTSGIWHMSQRLSTTVSKSILLRTLK